MRLHLLCTLLSLISLPLFGQSSIDFHGNPLPIDFSGIDPWVSGTATKSPAPLIKVFPSPNQSVALDEVAFDGKHLWVAGYNEFFLHQISAVDGHLIKSIPTHVKRPYGLAHDGEALWILDADQLQILRLDTNSGSVLRAFHTPGYSEASYPGGLCWDGTYFWTADRKGPDAYYPGDSIFKIDVNGNVVEAFRAKGNFPSALAHDGTYLWSTDNETKSIYKIDLSTFEVEDTLEAPGGDFPNGLTFDGRFLWVANNDHDSIYQIARAEMPLSTAQPNTAHSWQLFPNPARDQVQVSASFPSVPQSLEIYSTAGKLVKTVALNSLNSTLDVSQLKQGMYLVRWGEQVERLLIER